MRLPAGNPRSTGWHATGAAVGLWDLKADFPNQAPRRLSHATPLTEDSLLAVAFSGDETRLAGGYGHAAEGRELTQPDPPQHVAGPVLCPWWIDAGPLQPD